MLIFALDDEPLLLRKLKRTLEEVLPEAKIRDFTRASAALKAMEEEKLSPDVIFLDIEMPGMTGMKLAETITNMNPKCHIVFCTSYPQYALDAIWLHVEGYLGYLLKPITKEAVEKEIQYIQRKEGKVGKIVVNCFGNFEAFYNGEPIRFRRTLSKELFALLIDRNGAGVTAKQICTWLWEDGTDDKKNMNYLYQLFDDLRTTLSAVNAEDILQKKGYFYSIDTSKVICDYYEYLKVGKPQFYGEYMSQYSWAEETCAMLERKMISKD